MTLRSLHRSTMRSSSLAWSNNTEYQKLRGLAISMHDTGVIRSKRRLFKAGQLGEETSCSIINPGALHHNKQFHLLCRGEANDSTWVGDWSQSQATPVWCILDDDFTTRDYFFLRYRDLPQGYRPEDWRLFNLDGQFYSNHSIYMENGDGLICRPGISLVDLKKRELQLCMELDPPFKASREEKNWSMFVHDGKLLCIYSFDPYIVLHIDLSTCTIETVVNDGGGVFGWINKSGRFIGISTNLISWDEQHYIVFVHDYLDLDELDQRNRVYMQYGVLVDKLTLNPNSVIPTPLLMGGLENGRHPGVHYTMSLVNKDGELYAFYGEGDTHSGVVAFDNKILADLFLKHRC